MKHKGKRFATNRREFISAGGLSACTLLFSNACEVKPRGLQLTPEDLPGGIRQDPAEAPIRGAAWYVAKNAGDGFTYRFPMGALAKAACLTADMLLDGRHMIVFLLKLQEGKDGRSFNFRFAGLNQCSFRVRMPLSLVDQNRWGIDREGAFLKPRCSGARVDLARVDRMTLVVYRKSSEPARWWMTPFLAAEKEIEKIVKPVLPRGPLLDELGQSTIHDWPAKTRSVEEVALRIRSQLADAPKQRWPDGFSRWGGWKAKQLGKGAGFFRTHQDGGRWWLVDPDGYAFWSAGLDCVRVDTTANYAGLEAALSWLPDANGEFRDVYQPRRVPGGDGKLISYLAANLIRAFGPDGWRQKWAQVALAQMRRLRFNTVGNWSEWEFARRERFPYVRPLSFQPKRVANVYRDFPDVFHPEFEKDAADYAGQLSNTVDDPALIGYFLMNEPTWGFSSETPAAGMLFHTPSCETRMELSRYLRNQYPTDAALSQAWGIRASLQDVASGQWTTVLPKPALEDLQAFSSMMVDRYFKTLSDACKSVDPRHLNLGMRWAGVPPVWAVRGMKPFDVFSMNCYRQKVPSDDTKRIHDLLRMPIMVGEWHFGALDAGLPSSGIGHVRNQKDRGRAYRVYIEDAAANPFCVGTHWFTLYDESALGRFDGENYNIGFLDVCNRPYEELGQAAITSHERMYEVAAGRWKPFDDAPEYLPNLY